MVRVRPLAICTGDLSAVIARIICETLIRGKRFLNTRPRITNTRSSVWFFWRPKISNVLQLQLLSYLFQIKYSDDCNGLSPNASIDQSSVLNRQLRVDFTQTAWHSWASEVTSFLIIAFNEVFYKKTNFLPEPRFS